MRAMQDESSGPALNLRLLSTRDSWKIEYLTREKKKKKKFKIKEGHDVCNVLHFFPAGRICGVHCVISSFFEGLGVFDWTGLNRTERPRKGKDCGMIPDLKERMRLAGSLMSK
ncbi:hypothetical protein ABW19_dt0207983 [Dactylella cylindrospora]|nr:hypothetical protein ABW19_dt0207983 [Dactylella cylindrospora]